MHKRLALSAEPNFLIKEVTTAASTLTSIFFSFLPYVFKLHVQQNPSAPLLSHLSRFPKNPFSGLVANTGSSFAALYSERLLIELGEQGSKNASPQTKEAVTLFLALVGGIMESWVNRTQDMHARNPHTSFFNHLSFKFTRDLIPASVRNAAAVLGCTLFPKVIQENLDATKSPGLEATLLSTLLTTALSAWPDYMRECIASVEKNTVHLRQTLAQFTKLTPETPLNTHLHQLKLKIASRPDAHPAQRMAWHQAEKITEKVLQRPHTTRTAVSLMHYCHQISGPGPLANVGGRMLLARALFSFSIIAPIVGINRLMADSKN